MAMAQESDQIKKAREKLKRQFEEEQKQITPEALNEMQDRIYRWIERHSRERVNLRDKNVAVFSLFDTNEHSAKTASKFVHRLRSQLKREVAEEAQEEGAASALGSLKGRIKRVEG